MSIIDRLKTFGNPVFMMIMPLKKDRDMARVHIGKLRSDLKIKGFYLQLPPPTENLLKIHLQQQDTD
mgnify:CR=1 FL=1